MRTVVVRTSCVAATLCLLASLAPAAPTTSLISVGSGGAAANGHSGCVSLSANGRYAALVSEASNLVAGDTNGAADVFIQDLQTKSVSRVSVSSTGAQANGPSGDWTAPAISSDGRYVAFASAATNLATVASDGIEQVFIHDNQTGATTCVSVDGAGNAGNRDSYYPAISSDGSKVAFASNATNLITNDLNDAADVFVRDVVAGTTRLVSSCATGEPSDGPSGFPAISGNGRFVAFVSAGANLVAGDTNEAADVFVRDLETGTITLVSASTDGTPGDDWSDYPPGISQDGRYVGFISNSTNLSDGPVTDTPDAFVRDLQSGSIYAVSVAPDGTPANDASFGIALSADGRFVAVSSSASNLVATDTNGAADVFVRDLWLGKTVLASTTGTSTQGNGWSGPFAPPSLSADGGYVAFESWATNFATVDTNSTGDVFERGPLFTPPSMTIADAIDALRGAGGINVLSGIQFTRLDVEPAGSSGGVVDLADATRIARKATGLEP